MLIEALERRRAALARCHRDVGGANGELTFRVVIGVGGRVEAIAIAEPSNVPAKLTRCVEPHVRGLAVGAAPATASVTLHFRVSPYDGPTVLVGDGPFDPGY